MEEGDLKPFLNLPVPLVLLDSYFETTPCNSVLINNTQGAYNATRYLIQKCHYNAVRSFGMSASKSIVHRLTPSMEGAYADMMEIIHSGEDLSGCYFADNDLIAVGAIKALKQRGYRIPEDISIVGFDNLPISSVIDPNLTTIHVPKQFLGEMAAQRLMQLMYEPVQPPVKIEISTELIKRGSVFSPKKPK